MKLEILYKVMMLFKHTGFQPTHKGKLCQTFSMKRTPQSRIIRPFCTNILPDKSNIVSLSVCPP